MPLEINEDVQGFVAAGSKLSPKDMDLTTVGDWGYFVWVLTFSYVDRL